MKGKVKVLPKGAKAPPKAKDLKAVKQQDARTVKRAKRLAAETPKGEVVRAGNEEEVAFFAFSPGVARSRPARR